MSDVETKTESIVLGGGCFWCVEAAYQMVSGVVSAQSGYAGGHDPAPTYESVCGGGTGHAEVVKVTFDPAQVSLDRILELFWRIHDPTTRNRQGNDVGTQYRSIILHANETQRAVAEKSLAAANVAWDGKVVTELEPLGQFFPAEPYHDDYFRKNPGNGYCQVVVGPKLAKFRQALEGA